MSKLQEGWDSCSLEELLTCFESGSRPRGGVRGIKEGVPSIGGEHLTYGGTFDFSNIKHVPKTFAANMTQGHIQTSDILIVKDGATTGKTAFVAKDFPHTNAVVNEHVFVCRPTELIEPYYLFRYLTSKEGQTRILENFQGSAQGGINRSFAAKTEVPLAPLNEQRRVVAKLENLLSLVHAAQARLDTVPRILKRFRQSVLAAACSGNLTADWRAQSFSRENAFTLLERVRSQRLERWKQAEIAKHKSKDRNSRAGKLTEKYPVPRRIDDSDLPDIPPEWLWASLDEISYRLTYGITVRPNYVADGVSLISAREVRSGEIDLLKANRISRNDYDGLREKCRIYLGDVLFSKTGTVGSVARVKTSEPLCSSQNIAVISPLIDSAFLEIVLRSTTIQQRAARAVKNTAVSDLQLGIMAHFPIPVPPFVEQEEIVRRVEALFKNADALEARYRRAKAHINKLTQSILAKAFRGELVSQDPDDEPASVLLKRIKGSSSDLKNERTVKRSKRR